MSALQQLETDTSPQLRLETTPNLSILMAGINDGRHVLVTAMDLYQEYQEMNNKNHKDVQVTIVCNDINKSCMARFVLICMILYKIGTTTNHFADLKKKEHEQAARWCAVLQYVYLGYAMPSWINDLLIQVMQEFFLYENRQQFIDDYPWLPCRSDEDWEQVQIVMSYWLEQAGGSLSNRTAAKALEKIKEFHCKPIPSVEESLDVYFEYSEGCNDSITNSLSSKEQESLQNAKQSETVAYAEQMKERYSNLDNWSPELRQKYRENFPELRMKK